MTRLDATARYAVAGERGVWRYVGQATYLDDHGRTVDHDHVRMALAGRLDVEVWCSPGDVTRLDASAARTA